MRTLLLCAVALLLALAPVRAEDRNAFPKEVRTVLEKATALELYSLDPTREAKKDAFHRWKILGSTTVKQGEARNQLVAALVKGVEENQELSANCFQPRHGLRATYEGTTVDLVICFQCHQIEVHIGKGKDGGEKEFKELDRHILVSKSPEPTLDSILKEAGVMLADKPGK